MYAFSVSGLTLGILVESMSAAVATVRFGSLMRLTIFPVILSKSSGLLRDSARNASKARRRIWELITPRG